MSTSLSAQTLILCTEIVAIMRVLYYLVDLILYFQECFGAYSTTVSRHIYMCLLLTLLGGSFSGYRRGSRVNLIYVNAYTDVPGLRM